MDRLPNRYSSMALLEQSVAVNGFDNATLVCAAASDRSALMKLGGAGSRPDAKRLLAPSEGEGEAHWTVVPTVTIDELLAATLNDQQRVRLLKIDAVALVQSRGLSRQEGKDGRTRSW